MDDLDTIFQSDLAEIEKVRLAFGSITANYVDFASREVEIARALNDSENLVKNQIQMNLWKSVREIFAFCYLRSTGRKAWDE